MTPMVEPIDLMMPLLREIRGEIATFRKETGERLKALETGQKNIRNALSGDTVLGRMVVGEYEERIASLEQKIEALVVHK